MSNVSKGAYYKRKTRTWFENQGYYTELAEYKTAIPIKGRIIFITKDLLAADGIAMSKEKNKFILWNSKGISNEDSYRASKSKGRRSFAELPFPDCVERWLVIWRPRIPTPEIVKQ